MKIDIDFSDYSRRFLYELAETTKSPGVLSKIVDFAINVDKYKDGESNSEWDFYLEAVADNKNLSEKDMIKILRYEGSPYSRWGIIQRKDLSIVMVDKIAKIEKDYSLIDVLLNEHEGKIKEQLPETRKQIMETIAKRILTGKITIGKCVMDEFNPGHKWFEVGVIEPVIKKLAAYCTAETTEKLELWIKKYK